MNGRDHWCKRWLSVERISSLALSIVAKKMGLAG